MLKPLTVAGLLIEYAALSGGIFFWSRLTVSERLFWVVLFPLFAAFLVAWAASELVQQTGKKAWMLPVYASTVPSFLVSTLVLFLSAVLGH